MARVWTKTEKGTERGDVDALLIELDNGKVFHCAWLRHSCDDRDLAVALQTLADIAKSGGMAEAA